MTQYYCHTSFLYIITAIMSTNRLMTKCASAKDTESHNSPSRVDLSRQTQQNTQFGDSVQVLPQWIKAAF